jgi:hypothetical protein
MLSQKIEDDGGQECFGLHRNAMQWLFLHDSFENQCIRHGDTPG